MQRWLHGDFTVLQRTVQSGVIDHGSYGPSKMPNTLSYVPNTPLWECCAVEYCPIAYSAEALLSAPPEWLDWLLSAHLCPRRSLIGRYHHHIPHCHTQPNKDGLLKATVTPTIFMFIFIFMIRLMMILMKLMMMLYVGYGDAAISIPGRCTRVSHIIPHHDQHNINSMIDKMDLKGGRFKLCFRKYFFPSPKMTRKMTIQDLGLNLFDPKRIRAMCMY